AVPKPIQLQEILRGCTEAIVRHLDGAFARIWMLSKDESTLELQARAGMYTRLDGSYSRIPVGDLKVGAIAREKKAHLTNDVMNDPRVSDKGWAQSNGMVAFAGYPLVVEDRLIGVVALFAHRPLSESILDTLASVADTIAQGVERKRAEEDLRNALDEIQKSESKLRQVIDAIPALAWCNLPDGPNEFLNKGWHEYTGLSAEQSHGWGWRAAFHPEDLPPLMEKWMKMLTSGESDEVEARLRRHDGVYRWFLIRAEPFRDESGKIVRWYGTSTDIDDRKQAEEALQSSERNLRQVIDTIPTLIHVLGPDGSVLYVNPRVLDYTGLTLEDVQQGDYRARVGHPEDAEEGLRERRAQALSSAVPFESEYRVRGKDGQYRWFLARYNPLLDDQGKIDRWYVAATDIDDRKRAEEALRQSEERAHLMVDSIDGQIMTATPKGEVEFVNQQVLDYFGKSLEELKDWRTNDAIHPDDFPGALASWLQSVETGEPYQFDERLRRADGAYRWFRVRGRCVRDSQGHVVRWYVLLTDIDEGKLAEAQVEQSYLRLAEAQQLSKTGSFITNLLGGGQDAAPEGFTRFSL